MPQKASLRSYRYVWIVAREKDESDLLTCSYSKYAG